MIYNQVIFSNSGLVGYAEYDQSGFSRHTNSIGETISPIYDNVITLSGTIQPISNLNLPQPGAKSWMQQGFTYQQVSFLSGAVQGYQTNDGVGNIAYTDASGNPIVVGANGLTEIHIIAGNVPPPSWAS